MKKTRIVLLLLVAIVCSINLHAQTDNSAPPKGYNAELAKKLGADDYGMKSYVLVILKTGPADAEIKDKKKREKLFAGHFANMGKLAKEEKLALAGPFVEGKPFRGLFIFNVRTLEEAVGLVQTDPAVKAGIFVYEMKKWYGSAALMKVGEIHDTLKKPPATDK